MGSAELHCQRSSRVARQRRDFFLPGLLINLAYGLAFAISALVRWPGWPGSWCGDWRPDRLAQGPAAEARAYYIATWLWAGMFGLCSRFSCRCTSLNLLARWNC